MKISAVKLYDKGYMLQPFAFGGEDGPEAFDPAVRYRSSLQNYVIDTGDEVILVDTGMPKEVPQAVPDAATPIFMGIKGDDYVDALKKLGYEPEQISKILITHKHADHTGELRNFPNAKIYASVEECETEELLHYPNLVPVAFCKKGYENFHAAEKIAEGVWFVQAKGHTAGNSIVIVEDGELYYMIHGDVTYTDEALYENKLSVVYEDLVRRWAMRTWKRKPSAIWTIRRRASRHRTSRRRKPPESISARSAAMCMTLPNMTAPALNNCRRTGNARAAGSRRTNSTGHEAGEKARVIPGIR